MKKLLSLLSILTISGTVVPTTIAASPYQKEETIINSGINYQQKNNLEILKRFKRGTRGNNYSYPEDIAYSRNIKDIFPNNVIISVNLPRGFAQNNNPPENFEILNALRQQYGVDQNTINHLMVRTSNRFFATISGIPGSGIYGTNYVSLYPAR